MDYWTQNSIHQMPWKAWQIVEKKRHAVRPGLTGLAQVNGRNAISWESKFNYDVRYVETQSFGLDCQIIFQTIMKVFKKEGITSETSATMEKFNGNEK